MLEKGLLGVTVLLLAGVLYVFRDSVQPQIRSVLALGRTPVGVQKGAAVAPTNSNPRANPHRRRAQRLAINLEVPLKARPVPPVLRTFPMPPAPDEVQIRSGLSRAEVIDRFGIPTSSATWRDSRILDEKFIYLDRQKTTMVLLQNGKVISSRTDTFPRRITSAPEQISIEWD